MPNIRIDRVISSSYFPAFINYDNSPDNIVVTATPLADGASRDISVVIPYTRGGTIADIYATRGSIRTPVNTGGRAAASAIYSFTSSETARFDTIYSSTNITVTLRITNNTGGPITPNAQTIAITVVQYDAPITSV
jgi:hypothetical protein